MFILVLAFTSALEITEIPTSGAYQPKRTRTMSVFDPIYNQILTFGGFDNESQKSLLSLTSFNLSTQKWSIITPQSNFMPPRISFPNLFLRKDRKILVFFGSLDSGQNPDIYSYNLIKDTWALETLGGDVIQGMSRFGFTSFVYNDINFVACYGGIRKDQISSDLFIINTDTLIARKLKAAGDAPNAKIAPSLVYYNKKLYLFGGDWPKASSQTYTELYAFSLETETWSIVESNNVKPFTRNYHYSYVYHDSMYLLYGTNEIKYYDEAWRFDFTTSYWSQIQIQQGHLRLFAGDVQVENKVYLLFGEDINAIALNSIDSYELGSVVKISVVVGNWVSPLARKNHCSQIISTNIYVFGGISDSGEALNDMWVYNIDNGVWRYIPASGDVFSPRYSFACIKIVGTAIAIFGGTDSINVFDDIYYFESINNYWIKVEFPTYVRKGNPRFNSCISYLNFYAFFFGGQDNRRGYSDFWMYNYLTRETHLLTSNLLPFTLINHRCWGEVVDADYIFYIAGGTTYERLPNKKVYKVIVKETTFTYNISEIYESDYLAVSNPGFIAADNEIYMFFGMQMNYYVSSKIISYNFRRNEISALDVPYAYITTSSTAVHYGKSFYVFGGGLTSNGFALHSSSSSLFYKITPGKALAQLECSLGTYGEDCKPCPLGHFGYNQICVPCPAGRYSTSIAADNFIFCIPCDYNSFSSMPGSLRCLDCPSNMYCPIASTKPLYGLKIRETQNNQPAAYTSSTDFVNTVINQIILYFVLIAFLATSVVMLSTHLWDSIKKLDMFSNNHKQQLYVPVTYRTTSIGGLFTLYFVLTSSIVFIGSVLSYSLDNISETRSLVPLSTVDRQVVAEKLIVEINLLLYGGVCVVDNECYNYISVTEAGIAFDTRSKQCEYSDDNCSLRIIYNEFTLLGDSEIRIQYQDIFAFASAMMVNMSVTSSIPDQMSNVVVPILTPSPLEIFRGISPTILNFEFTPTIFTSESSKWPSESTGYHIIDEKKIILGSTATQETMNRNGYLMLTLGMNIARAGFIVKRIHLTGLSLFLGSLIGTILGLIGTFATIMSMCETTIDKGYLQIKRKLNMSKILSERKVNSSNFVNESEKNKVHPLMNDSSTLDLYIYS